MLQKEGEGAQGQGRGMGRAIGGGTMEEYCYLQQPAERDARVRTGTRRTQRMCNFQGENEAIYVGSRTGWMYPRFKPSTRPRTRPGPGTRPAGIL